MAYTWALGAHDPDTLDHWSDPGFCRAGLSQSQPLHPHCRGKLPTECAYSCLPTLQGVFPLSLSGTPLTSESLTLTLESPSLTGKGAALILPAACFPVLSAYRLASSPEPVKHTGLAPRPGCPDFPLWGKQSSSFSTANNLTIFI